MSSEGNEVTPCEGQTLQSTEAVTKKTEEPTLPAGTVATDAGGDQNLEEALAKLTNREVEAAATPPLKEPISGERMDTPDNQDGDAVGEQEAVCATHGKKRTTAYMAMQEDGTYTCVAPNLCKMPRQGPPQSGSPSPNGVGANGGVFPGGPPPGVMMMPAGPGRVLPPGAPLPPGIMPNSGSALSLGDQTVMCVVHGKYRSTRNMIRSESGEYRCQPTYQCQMERGGPGRKSPCQILQPSGSSSGFLVPPGMPGMGGLTSSSLGGGLQRNSSSNMSLGSNLSVDEINRLTAMSGVPGQQQTYVMASGQPGAPGTQQQQQYVVLQNSGSNPNLVGPGRVMQGAPQMYAAPPSNPGLMPSGSSSSLLQAPVAFIAQPPPTTQAPPSSGFMTAAPMGGMVLQQPVRPPQQMAQPPQQMAQPAQQMAQPPQQMAQPAQQMAQPPQQMAQPLPMMPGHVLQQQQQPGVIPTGLQPMGPMPPQMAQGSPPGQPQQGVQYVQLVYPQQQQQQLPKR